MTESNPRVLVTFYSREGVREALALACGVGVVQSRGVIRLRRMAGLDDGLPDSPVLERMRREYVHPTAQDIEWADALVFCGPDPADSGWDSYLILLRELAETGGLAGKVGTVIAGSGHSEADTSTEARSLRDLGVTEVLLAAVAESEVDDPARVAQHAGRQIADTTRALRRAKSSLS